MTSLSGAVASGGPGATLPRGNNWSKMEGAAGAGCRVRRGGTVPRGALDEEDRATAGAGPLRHWLSGERGAHCVSRRAGIRKVSRRVRHRCCGGWARTGEESGGTE
ncbi:hypothetical protein IMZ48_36010 [Candidatus Bathyarchaeota archaeon]|nr:hypothetical protein [Candidatus Bathyarchaeota archaeon]